MAPSALPTAAPPTTDRPSTSPPVGTVRPFAPALVVLLICGLGTLAVGREGWNSTDDGAAVVPIVALVAIAVASLRWRPTPSTVAIRPVSSGLAQGVNLTAAVLATTLIIRPDLGGLLIGPVMTLALVGSYLSLWGYRALALLRTVTLLSFLTWEPAAGFVHAVVRSSLQQPSDLLYRRLAQLPMLAIDEEPWRLFSSQLHRGSLVVIATVALGVGANRWRMSPRSVVDLILVVASALVAHHIVILLVPLDQYEPSEMTQLATNPTIELAISIVAVMGLSLIRSRRSEQDHVSPGGSLPSVLDDRDPVIFANSQRQVSPLTTGLLLTCLVPLITVALLG